MLLDINCGNRILTVSSFASKGVGLAAYIRKQENASKKWKPPHSSKVILSPPYWPVLTEKRSVCNWTLPCPVPIAANSASAAAKECTQDTNTVFLDCDEEFWNHAEYAENNINNAKQYEDEYLPRIWKDVTPDMLTAGHGGMDWFAYKAFVDAVKNNTQIPIDVYHSAVWRAVSVLSEISIAQGGAPQAMPDFIGGARIRRPRLDVCKI